MVHWGRWAVGAVARILGNSRATQASRKSRGKARPAVDGLERREMLSGVGSPPFVVVGGTIERAGRPAEVVFRLEPGQFVADRTMPMLLSLEAEPLPDSTVVPRITQVTSLQGRNTYNVVPLRGPMSTNVAVPNARPTLYRVGVRDLGGSATGDFVVKISLPGDTNGDGVVDRTDMGRVRASYGSNAGNRRYDPGADINGDGSVGHYDYGLTRRNMGARASVVVPNPGMPLGDTAVR